MTDREQAEGYRKALELAGVIAEKTLDASTFISEVPYASLKQIQRIAREALSDAATAQPKSLYAIPPGCICMGDGLMGMKCPAKEHAKLKQQPVPEAGDIWDKLATSPEQTTWLAQQLNTAQETILQRDERIKELEEQALQEMADRADHES